MSTQWKRQINSWLLWKYFWFCGILERVLWNLQFTIQEVLGYRVIGFRLWVLGRAFLRKWFLSQAKGTRAFVKALKEAELCSSHQGTSRPVYVNYCDQGVLGGRVMQDGASAFETLEPILRSLDFILWLWKVIENLLNRGVMRSDLCFERSTLVV